MGDLCRVCACTPAVCKLLVVMSALLPNRGRNGERLVCLLSVTNLQVYAREQGRNAINNSVKCLYGFLPSLHLKIVFFSFILDLMDQQAKKKKKS